MRPQINQNGRMLIINQYYAPFSLLSEFFDLAIAFDKVNSSKQTTGLGLFHGSVLGATSFPNIYNLSAGHYTL